MEFQASIARQCATRIERISVADAREPIYLIANQFGHRVITGRDLVELTKESRRTEEFDRLCDERIARNN